MKGSKFYLYNTVNTNDGAVVLERKRVVITGVGAVSPLGNDAESMWNNLIQGKSGVGIVTQVPKIEQYASQIAGEVKEFNADTFIPKKEQRRMDPFTVFGISAAMMAVADAGLEPEKEVLSRVGVIIGSGIGGLQIFEEQMKVYFEKGPSRFNPFMIPTMITNIVSGHVAIKYGFRGPNFCITSACATGAHSIGESFRMIQYGDADIMVAGGTEAAITPLGLGGFCVLRALSTRNDEPERASRPFDAERDGFVMGEGAGVLVLEELEHAKKRGAKIYAELAGYGRNADAFHMTAPSDTGREAGNCIKLALANAQTAPEDLDYINAHGTSTQLNDSSETRAIKYALGAEAAKRVQISSTKSMIGHLLGAAGGVEAVITAKAVREGVIPPTINYENPDPECDLDYVPNHARETKVITALSNSFGFGGHNASLCFKRYD